MTWGDTNVLDYDVPISICFFMVHTYIFIFKIDHEREWRLIKNPRLIQTSETGKFVKIERVKPKHRHL